MPASSHLPRPLLRFATLHVLAAGLALAFVVADAQAAGPIDTDGPDFVESSEAVGKGRFQYEADVSTQRDRRPQSAGALPGTTASTPFLLKYGVTETVELRVQTDGHLRVADTLGTQRVRSGAGDTALGVKWHSQDRSGTVPAVSWILHFDTPSGSAAFRGRGVRPSLRSVVTWDLPGDLALGLMPGLRYDATEDGRRYTAGIFGAVLNRRLSDTVRVFVEASAPQIARARDGGTVASWDVGAAWLYSEDTQLGVRSGIGANTNSPKAYVLFELAQRF